MKKIMFSDVYGLTEAVLSGRKTMTRRLLKGYPITAADDIEEVGIFGSDAHIIANGGETLITKKLPYQVGEVVAVAQSYKDAGFNPDMLQTTLKDLGIVDVPISTLPGWRNKMFTYPTMMPHQIRITDVRGERLQDISDEDCMAEGIRPWTKDGKLFKYDLWEGFEMFPWRDKPKSPRAAFAVLIDKVSGKGTWDNNPFVLAYDFELVK